MPLWSPLKNKNAVFDVVVFLEKRSSTFTFARYFWGDLESRSRQTTNVRFKFRIFQRGQREVKNSPKQFLWTKLA